MLDKKDEKQLIKIISNGIYGGWNQILLGLIVGFVIYIAVGYISGSFDKDSTDGHETSGMKLHMDNLTGCHYLGGKNGGLIPRISSDGKTHYGCKNK